MSNRFHYNNRSVLITRRVRALFNKMSADLNRQTRGDIYETTSKVLEGFKELYSNLGKPATVIEPFEPKQAPRSKKINKTMQDIEEDLRIAYEESTALNQSLADTFNHAQAVSKDIIALNEKVSSKVIDLRLLEGQLEQNILIVGDDFKDLSRIDQNFPLQNPPADTLIEQGVVVLKRSGSNNLASSNAEMKLSIIGPQGISTRPTINNTDRAYEGKFYDFIGNARPEGGRFHLEQTLSVNIQPTGITSNTVVVSNPNPNNVINIAQQELNKVPGAGQVLRPEDVLIYDRGASEQEKAVVRQNLFDDSPATFWECEYVKTEPSIQTQVEQSKLIGLDQNSIIVNTDGAIENNAVSSVTLDDLRNQASALSSSSTDDLILDLSISLQKESIVNWISLTPHNSNETAWMDVLDISYAGSSLDSFKTIPGFSNAIHDNVLTDEANAELSDGESGALLAPNKYSYRGIGVWSFEPVLAKVIKVRIRQRSAVPAPYQKLAVRLHRTFTQTYTETHADDPGI